MARLFDGTDDQIVCSLGTANTALNGAWTIAICARPDSSSVGGIVNTTGGNDWSIWQDGTNLWVFTASGPERSFSNVLSIGAWQRIIVSKPAGSATPRVHVYNYATDTHTHTDGSGTLANDTASAGRNWVIGREDFNGDTFDGAIAGIAMYGSATTDGVAEGLETWDAWLAATPAIAWDFRTIPLVDEGSGASAHQTSITGTTATDPPAGFFSPNVVEAAAALAGAGGLSASGRRLRHGTTSLAGVGALSAGASAVRFGAATFAGVGTLSADADVIGGVNVVAGAASLAATGALSSSASAVRRGTVALAATAMLSATARVGGSTPIHRNPRVSVAPLFSALGIEPRPTSLALADPATSLAVMPHRSSIEIEED